MNDLKPGDVLFHGTSMSRWRSIQQDGRLRLPTSGDLKISLTTDFGVAVYWAKLASASDGTVAECRAALAAIANRKAGVVLVLSHSALETSGHWLTEFNDDFWGEGECDWEQEIACWSDIDIAQVAIAFQLDAATV